MSIVHDLKTLPVYFDAVARGEKTFEIRRDDRGYQRGDMVRLLRLDEKPNGPFIYSNGAGSTTGLASSATSLTRRILWILTGGQFGLEPGYVILALGTPQPTPCEGKTETPSPDRVEAGGRP